jgi:hypothetical protein
LVKLKNSGLEQACYLGKVHLNCVSLHTLLSNVIVSPSVLLNVYQQIAQKLRPLFGGYEELEDFGFTLREMTLSSLARFRLLLSVKN